METSISARRRTFKSAVIAECGPRRRKPRGWHVGGAPQQEERGHEDLLALIGQSLVPSHAAPVSAAEKKLKHAEAETVALKAALQRVSVILTELLTESHRRGAEERSRFDGMLKRVAALAASPATSPVSDVQFTESFLAGLSESQDE